MSLDDQALPSVADAPTRLAIYGAGNMGSGIALAFARYGFEVTLVDRNELSLSHAIEVIESALDLFVEAGLVEEAERPEIMQRIAVTIDGRSAAKGVGLVMECISENRDAKKALYEQLDQWCPEDTVFASNTSYLNIFDLVPASRLPRTLIAHWFAPAHILPLVEVVRGELTSDETVKRVTAWLRRAERVPIVMEKFIDGFCVNRLQRILGREIFFLLDNGYIKPDMLDIAVKASIVPRSMVVGFVQRYDFTGLDLSYGNLQNDRYTEPVYDNQPRSLTERLEKGDLGVRSGRGFFDYDGESITDVLKRRDERLLQVLERVSDLICARV